MTRQRREAGRTRGSHVWFELRVTVSWLSSLPLSVTWVSRRKKKVAVRDSGSNRTMAPYMVKEKCHWQLVWKKVARSEEESEMAWERKKTCEKRRNFKRMR